MEVVDKTPQAIKDCEAGDIVKFGTSFCMVACATWADNGNEFRIVDLEDGLMVCLGPYDEVQKIEPFTLTLTIGE